MPNTIDILWITAATSMFVALVIALAGYRPLPRGGRHCRHCGYDLFATPDEHRRCPECGGSLIGGVIEASVSESAIRWRNRLRRFGLTGIVLVVMLAMVIGFLDPRRLPHTPRIWLLMVDVPLAIRSPDEFATPVMREVLRRRRPGSTDVVSDADFTSVTRSIMDRFDESNHGGPEGRGVVIIAWSEGLVPDEDFLGLDWVSPRLRVETLGDVSPDAIDYRVMGTVDFTAPMGDFKSTANQAASFSFSLSPRRYRIGGQSEWLEMGGGPRVRSSVDRHFAGRSPTSTTMSLGQRIGPASGTKFPIGPTTLELEADYRLTVDSNGRRLQGDTIPIRLVAPIEVKTPVPVVVSMDLSEESCDRLKKDLESATWYEVTRSDETAFVSVHIGTIGLDRASIGTPTFTVDLELDGRKVTRKALFEESASPENTAVRMKVRFPGARRILDEFATIWLTDLGAFDSLTNLRLHVDTRTFDLAAWERIQRASLPRTSASEIEPIGCEFSFAPPKLDPQDVELVIVRPSGPGSEDSIPRTGVDTVETHP